MLIHETPHKIALVDSIHCLLTIVRFPSALKIARLNILSNSMKTDNLMRHQFYLCGHMNLKETDCNHGCLRFLQPANPSRVFRVECGRRGRTRSNLELLCNYPCLQLHNSSTGTSAYEIEFDSKTSFAKQTKGGAHQLCAHTHTHTHTHTDERTTSEHEWVVTKETVELRGKSTSTRRKAVKTIPQTLSSATDTQRTWAGSTRILLLTMTIWRMDCEPRQCQTLGLKMRVQAAAPYSDRTHTTQLRPQLLIWFQDMQ